MLASEEIECLGPALAGLRKRSGKTGRHVAEAIGRSIYVISRYEHGQVHPSCPSLFNYLKAVDADLCHLADMIGLMKFLRQIRQ